MTQKPPLIATNVSRTYGSTTVLQSATLALQPATITALLGQSGAGKSTLLRLFAGLERPDTGTITLGDKTLCDDKTMVPAEQRRVGLVFQDFALFPHLTAQQNVAFGLTAMPKTAALDLASEWLAKMNLQDRASAFPYQMSGGEKQRVAIARALAPEPVAILMDEPFSGLDPALREDVRALALSTIRASGIPALLVTHDASEAMLSAEHLAVMRGGIIQQQGAPQSIYNQPNSIDIATALGPVIALQINADNNNGETPFGPFPLPLPSSGVVSLGIRPEGVLIDDTSPHRVTVISSRRNGPMLQIRVQADSLRTDILAPHTTMLTPGQTFGVRLDPQSCVIFA